MRVYDFAIQGRKDLPRVKLQAADDNDFFKNVLPKWEKETRHRHVEGDIMCTISEVMRIPEPPAEVVRDAFSPAEEKIANRIGIGASQQD